MLPFLSTQLTLALKHISSMDHETLLLGYLEIKKSLKLEQNMMLKEAFVSEDQFKPFTNHFDAECHLSLVQLERTRSTYHAWKLRPTLETS